jgi:hypothetical protein
MLRFQQRDGTSEDNNPFAKLGPYCYQQQGFRAFSDAEVRVQARVTVGRYSPPTSGDEVDEPGSTTRSRASSAAPAPSPKAIPRTFESASGSHRSRGFLSSLVTSGRGDLDQEGFTDDDDDAPEQAPPPSDQCGSGSENPRESEGINSPASSSGSREMKKSKHLRKRIHPGHLRSRSLARKDYASEEDREPASEVDEDVKASPEQWLLLGGEFTTCCQSFQALTNLPLQLR